MPTSRKRKSKGRGASSRTTRAVKKQSNQMTKAVVFLIIAALAVAVVFFIIVRTGGNSIPTSVPQPGEDGWVTTSSGLKYFDEVVGKGDSPKIGQMVTVHYTGTFDNGIKFDSSLDKGQPYTFPIGTSRVIRGWDEGVMSMKVGGKRRLIVPSNLGYGAEGRPGIPPNATLNFEIELLGIR